MCPLPIGTAFVEEPSSIEKIRANYPTAEIERLLIESNCFKLIDGGPRADDPMRIAHEIMKQQNPQSAKNTAPIADYKITASIVFTETGSGSGYEYNPLLGYNTRNSFIADKQNGRATIKLIDEKTSAVVAIATGEGVYQDTQWSFRGPATGRSENRVIEFAYKNAINNLVGQIDHLSKR